MSKSCELSTREWMAGLSNRECTALDAAGLSSNTMLERQSMYTSHTS